MPGESHQSPRLHWTQFPDILIDYWMPRLSGAEFKVLSYITRRTFGWREPDWHIPIRQFTEGRRNPDSSERDGGTGLTHSTVIVALQQLVALGLIVAEPDGQAGTIYRLAFDTDDTPPVVRKSDHLEPTEVVRKSDRRVVRKSDRQWSENQTTHPIRRQTRSQTDQQTLPLKRAQQTIAREAPAPSAVEQAAARAVRERELKGWERARLRQWEAAGHDPARIEEALSRAVEAKATSPFAYARRILADASPEKGHGSQHQGNPRRSPALPRGKVRPQGDVDVDWERWATPGIMELPDVPGHRLDR